MGRVAAALANGLHRLMLSGACRLEDHLDHRPRLGQHCDVTRGDVGYLRSHATGEAKTSDEAVVVAINARVE